MMRVLTFCMSRFKLRIIIVEYLYDYDDVSNTIITFTNMLFVFWCIVQIQYVVQRCRIRGASQATVMYRDDGFVYIDILHLLQRLQPMQHLDCHPCLCFIECHNYKQDLSIFV